MVYSLDDIELVDRDQGAKSGLSSAVRTTASLSETKYIRGDGGIVGLLLDALVCDDERALVEAAPVPRRSRFESCGHCRTMASTWLGTVVLKVSLAISVDHSSGTSYESETAL
ncbi:hypothetical protein ADL25_24210 [Streptomyces sp. NRRL F-5122]|nr:hypothetical protein ADL25_24210 [Streptomyces sp. NRRL F-5122]